MKLRYVLRDGGDRAIGPEGRGVGASGGEGGGGRLKAPNPQAPSSRETSIPNHQTGNSDAWQRLNTLGNAWRFGRRALRYGGRDDGQGGGELRGEGQSSARVVRPCAGSCGYVRPCADVGKTRRGFSKCYFLATCKIMGSIYGIIFTSSVWATQIGRLVRICPDASAYLSRSDARSGQVGCGTEDFGSPSGVSYRLISLGTALYRLAVGAARRDSLLAVGIGKMHYLRPVRV
jgi:hypothetical protein